MIELLIIIIVMCVFWALGELFKAMGNVHLWGKRRDKEEDEE